jgi:hypothetical protein
VFGLSESIEEALGAKITVVARKSQAQSAEASIRTAKQSRLDSWVTRNQSAKSKEGHAEGEVTVE